MIRVGNRRTLKKRIIIVGPAQPFRGGIAHFSNRLAQALRARFEVKLLTFSRQYPQFLFPGKTQYEQSTWDLPHVPEQRIDSINPRSWKKSGTWLAEQRPDIIMIVHWLPFFVPAYLGVLKAYRKALPAGEVRASVNLFLHNVYPHKKFPFTTALMRRFLVKADSFFTMSNHVTDQLKALVPDAKVYEGFHPVYDIFEPAIASQVAREELGIPDRPTMLFFGYVRKYKGLDLLIEALPLLAGRLDVQLLVAGEFYDGEDDVRGRIEELGLTKGDQPTVRLFSDYIPNESVHLYFSAADVIVQPYRSATPSGVVQTAFYFNKPMIVTDLGVLAEVVPHGVAGLVIPPENPAALADSIVEFFDRGPESFVAGVASQRAKYSWDELAEQLEGFLTVTRED